jgi:hypothetical protein
LDPDEIKNTKYSNSANGTGTIVTTTTTVGPTTPLNVDYSSGTTVKTDDKKQVCIKNLTSDAPDASDASDDSSVCIRGVYSII